MATPTGPQIYPGASTTHWYGDSYSGDRMDVNAVVWHSTEGTSLPDYDGGATAPTITAVPDFDARKLRWFQHFRFDVSARALVNRPGGVKTNTLNVAQVEIVGTCDPATHKKWGKTPHLYMPELPDWAVRDLAAFVTWAHDEHGVPLTSGVTFKAYPGSYGADNGVRLTFDKWNAFEGHLGHMHAPENLHGDPGAFPMQAILNAAKPVPPKTPAAPKPPSKPAAKPVVSLKHVVAAARRDPGGRQGATTHKAEVRLVEDALVKLRYLDKRWADGSFGTYTVAAYARLQRHLGYAGAAADGIPGAHSLRWLGLRTGLFTDKD